MFNKLIKFINIYIIVNNNVQKIFFYFGFSSLFIVIRYDKMYYYIVKEY